jgi:hypothetical protein
METALVEQIVAQEEQLPVQQEQFALQSSPPRHLRLKGVTVGEGPKLTLEALQEARKEMWGEYVEDGE